MDHPVDLIQAHAGDGFIQAPPRSYTRRRFLTNVWKTGNYLRSLGVHEDSLVAIVSDPDPDALLSFFGASLLGARVRFGPPAALDARVVVGPTESLDQFDLPPGGQYLGYGAEPEDPSWSYFGRDVWSENPSFPAVDHDPATVLLETGRERYETGSVVGAAHEAATSYDETDVVAVRAPLATPGTVVAGVLAPIAAGATILLPDQDATGTVAVSSERRVPEDRTVDPKHITIPGRSV